MAKFNFLNPLPQGRGGGRIIVTVETFFENGDSAGYIKKETFKQMMTEMRDKAPALVANYKDFFNAVRDRITISNSIDKQTHQTNNSDYYYLSFRQGKQRFGTTIYEVEGIGQFIKDYANGVIETDFNLEQLIFECNK